MQAYSAWSPPTGTLGAIVAEALGINTRLQAAVQAKLERLATFKAELEAKADRYTTSLAGLQDRSGAGVGG